IATDDRHPYQPGQQSDYQAYGYGDRWIGQPVVELDRAELLEQDGYPEHRQREEQEGGERDRVIQAAVLPQRGDDPGRDADDDRQDRGAQNQLERLTCCCGDECGDILARDAGPEVALHCERDEAADGAPRPDEIPDWRRYIKAQ